MATATAVARAVTEGKPLVERIVTVTGNGVGGAQNDILFDMHTASID